MFICFFTLCSWKHGDAWHALTLPNARSASLRLGAPMQPSKWSPPPASCGSRGEEVQPGTTPSPRPTGSLSWGTPQYLDWGQGGADPDPNPHYACALVPGWGCRKGRLLPPGMQRGHGAGRTHPGEVGRGGTRHALLSHHLLLQKTDSKIKGRIPRWQPQALNSEHGVFWAGAVRQKYYTNLQLVYYWETLQPETWLHSQLCPFSPIWP